MADGKYDGNDFTTRIATASATTIDFESMRIMCINSNAMPALKTQ